MPLYGVRAIVPDDYELGGELMSDGHDDRVESCRAFDEGRSRTVNAMNSTSSERERWNGGNS